MEWKPALFVTITTLALLAGCTTPRNAPPDVRLHASATAEETVSCLVRTLDAQFPGSAFAGGIAHHATLIVPGQVYEVTPTRPLSWFGENYSVRVTAEDGAALMELRAVPNWVSTLEPAMQECTALEG